MFDLGFSELLVIGLVALIVIGPERLPKVARTAGAWLGRLNRFVSQVKQDVERDVQLDELRKMQKDMKESAQRFEIMAEETSEVIQKEVNQVDKVIQAMSVTDGGLAAEELAKVKAEQAAETESKAETTPEPAAQAQLELGLEPGKPELSQSKDS